MPNRRQATILVLALACTAAHPSASKAASRPDSMATIRRDQHVERQRQSAAFKLLEAAWRADPAYSRSSGHVWRSKTIQHLNASAALVSGVSSPFERAAILYEYLKNSVLVGEFDPGCARVSRTVCHGDHNCLTGTLLYLALCRNAGITCAALESPGHVRVKLTIDNRTHVVETTQQNGLSHAVSANEVSITDRQLIARVYYNLGISLAKAFNYQAATRLTWHALQLDPSHAPARNNWLATLNNWSIELIQRGDLDQASALIQRGLAVDQAYEPLRRGKAYLEEHGR